MSKKFRTERFTYNKDNQPLVVKDSEQLQSLIDEAKKRDKALAEKMNKKQGVKPPKAEA